MADLHSDGLLATLQWQSHNTQHEDVTYIANPDFADNALADLLLHYLSASQREQTGITTLLREC